MVWLPFNICPSTFLQNTSTYIFCQPMCENIETKAGYSFHYIDEKRNMHAHNLASNIIHMQSIATCNCYQVACTARCPLLQLHVHYNHKYSPLSKPSTRCRCLVLVEANASFHACYMEVIYGSPCTPSSSSTPHPTHKIPCS